MKKFWNILGDILLGLIVVFAVFGIIYGFSAKSSSNNGVPRIFGQSAYAVPTTSMNITKAQAAAKGIDTKTLIHKGDIVFGNSNVSYKDIQVGDVIFFWGALSEDDTSAYIIVHRVVDIGKDNEGNVKYLITRGDNPSIPEDQVQTVTEGNYIAKYSGKLPGVGFVILFLTTNTWINYIKTDGTENGFLKGLYNFKLPIGFGLVIVLPMFIYLLVMIFRLISVMNNNKKVDAMSDIAAGVQSDAVKEAIIQEYLKKQEEQKQKEALAQAQIEPKADEVKQQEETKPTDENK